jgi:hypothetical protein
MSPPAEKTGGAYFQFQNTPIPSDVIQQHGWEIKGPSPSEFAAALWHSGMVKNYDSARHFDFKRWFEV